VASSAQQAHGQVIQLAEDRLAVLGRIEAGELVADRVEPVSRRGAPLADQRYTLNRVMGTTAAHPIPIKKHQSHPRVRPFGCDHYRAVTDERAAMTELYPPIEP
jgi:hypothetical protein